SSNIVELNPHFLKRTLTTLYCTATHDVLTGDERPLKSLTSRFHWEACRIWLSSLSPDGKWLLWEDDPYIYVSTLDASHFLRWKQKPDSSLLIWLSDSRHFANIGYDKEGYVARAYVRDVTAPMIVKTINLAAAIGYKRTKRLPYLPVGITTDG